MVVESDSFNKTILKILILKEFSEEFLSSLCPLFYDNCQVGQSANYLSIHLLSVSWMNEDLAFT